MSADFEHFVARGRRLAEAGGLSWEFQWDSEGSVPKAVRWNLSAIRGEAVKPIVRLGTVSTYEASFQALAALGRGDLVGDGKARAMPNDWVELYKAIIAHDQLAKGNKPANAITNIGSAFRILATCVGERSPAQINADDVRLAFNVALRTGDSGKRGALLQALVRKWFDTYRISENSPLASYCRWPRTNGLARAGMSESTIDAPRKNSGAGLRETRRGG